MTYQAGGRITINGGGLNYSPRGKAIIDAAGIENDAMENHDGTVSRSTKAKAVTAEITLDRGNAASGTQRPKWDQSFTQAFADWTLKEVDTGVLHLFSNAFIKGTPKLDTETGEVSGCTICCAAADYTQTSS